MNTTPLARSVTASGVTWVLSFGLARLLLRDADLDQALRIGAALLPVAPFAWFLWAFVAQVRRMDELERRIHLEALALAFPLAMLLLMTLGLLELAIALDRDDWSYRHVWGFLPLLYFAGLALARRRFA